MTQAHDRLHAPAAAAPARRPGRAAAAASTTAPSASRAPGAAAALRDELAAARAMTLAVLESTADAMLATDDAGRVTAFNDRLLQVWGFRREDVDGASLADLAQRVAPRLRDPAGCARRVAEIAAADDDPADADLVELVDGRVLERTVRQQRVDGRRVGRVWSYRDVTARRDAESALRDEAGVLQFLNRTGATIAATLDVATLLQTVIDAATDVSGAAFGAFLYRVDRAPAAGAFDGLRPEHARIVSAGAREPEGIPMLALAGISQPPPGTFDAQRTAALFGAAWRGERAVRCDDVTRVERYGATAAWFGVAEDVAPVRSFLAVPVTLRSGATVGGLFFAHPEVGVFTARTERIVVGLAAHAAIALENARLVEGMRRVAAERERLVEAERAARAESVRAARIKDEFLSTLSHELRTPLTAILGWSKVLQLRPDDAPTRQRGLEAIERNANAQTALIEDLLDMSRIVSGQVQLQRRPVEIGDVVVAAVDAARPAALARRQVLACRVEPGLGIVVADGARIGQVVGNLLSNAIRFTPEAGRVAVDARRVGDEVEIAVEDTGQGIEPGFVDHVFDCFRQADASTTRRHGGLGLGLAIVKQLVALHGGAASATSPGPGRGARFVVRLPRGDAATPAAPAAAAASPLPASFADVDLRGLRLLVVDDEVDVRELVARLLEECGAEVEQAADADSALAALRRAPPDLLLSDIGMPDRDGYELLREIRALPASEGGAVPAIALTAFTRPEDRAQAQLAGYQAHLPKPIQPQALVAEVARLARAR